MGDREPRRDRPDRPTSSSALGKRGPFDQERGARGANGFLHFRLLVQLKKAGSVIGKGGDFIQMTKNMTGAKLGVDKAVGSFDERLAHLEGFDEPGKPIAGIQEALLRTAERIMGEEGQGGQVKLPHKCQLRMLLFKYQIGAVMGKKGATINEIRNKSGASVKLTTPKPGTPIVPCAERDDELITIVGTPEQTLTALKMISDRLRAVLGAGASNGDRGPDRPDKRSRGSDDRRSEPPRPDLGGPPPERWDRDAAPPGHMPPPMAPPAHMAPAPLGPPGPSPPGAPPPGGAIAMALPHAVRGVLANNDSVKTEGLVGPVTVEYRVLVPTRRSGVILGGKGGVIKDIRNRTGARVQMWDEEKGCSERILQLMSTEDVQDQHCAAFDAAMDCINALLRDDSEPTVTVRIILPHGQVGAVMGKAGSTIKELRHVSGCSIHLNAHPDVPRCVKKGEEVMEMRGSRDAVMLATHIALIAIRGNMARGQLIYNYPAPAGAPPPSARTGPPMAPPHMGAPPAAHYGAPPPAAPYPGHDGAAYGAPPPQYGAPPATDPRLQQQPAPVPRGRSRWDSEAAPSAGQPPQHQTAQPPPGATVVAAGPPPGVVYADASAPPPQYAAPPPQHHVVPQPAPQPQQQVQYVQGPPPSNPPVQVVYSSQPPPAGFVPAPQQQVVYTGPDGQTYVQQQPAPQQQPPVQVVQQQPAPVATTTSQPMVVYTSPDGQTQYVQQHVMQQPQPVQQQPQQAAGQPQQVTYVYTTPSQTAAPAAAAPAAPSSTGPGSTSGYGGLSGMVNAVAAPPAAVAPAPVAAAPAPVPKARVLLTQEQVVRLRLDDKNQCVQLGALSGAVITLSDHILENGAREVLLAGTDQQCNTAKNLMEALMRSG